MTTLIVGAGAAGLACAYELTRSGQPSTLLEAQTRLGGRCLTIRRGTRLPELGQPDQHCEFREGLYFNPGPARIPQHHVTAEYCRQLGVPLEPFVNRNNGAFLHTDSGSMANQRVPFRDLDFDLRGRSYELLFRAIQNGTVGGEWSAEVRTSMLAYLKGHGSLEDADGSYHGRHRRTPGGTPPSLETLLGAGLAWKLGFVEEFDMQPTMLQVVGGTDRLTDALGDAVDSDIHLGTTVRRITVSDQEVCVDVEDSKGKSASMRASRCVITLPLPVLATVENNLPTRFQEAVTGARYEPAVKVGLESPTRWWESEMHVYGGMTFTDLDSVQTWYPSAGMGSEDGVLLGAYNFGASGVRYSDMTPADRVSQAQADVETIHGRAAPVRSGVSVAWRNHPWSRGAYSLDDHSGNDCLRAPHPRIRLAGEHMSGKNGWIAGALESGQAAAQWVTNPSFEPGGCD